MELDNWGMGFVITGGQMLLEVWNEPKPTRHGTRSSPWEMARLGESGERSSQLAQTLVQRLGFRIQRRAPACSMPTLEGQKAREGCVRAQSSSRPVSVMIKARLCLRRRTPKPDSLMS